MAPVLYEETFCNNITVPFSGNVPMIQDTQHIPRCQEAKIIPNVVMTTFGPATGVNRRALMTTLSGVVNTGPLQTYLNSAETRQYTLPLQQLGTFSLDQDDLAFNGPSLRNAFPY